MMRGPVLAYKSAPVKAEHHIQLLKGNIVNDLVVGSLQEGGIYITERDHARRSKAGAECDGMLLGNPDIESSFRHLGHHHIEGAASGHGRGDPDNKGILFGKFDNAASKHSLVFRSQPMAFILFDLSCLFVKNSGGMKNSLVFFGLFIAFSFDRVNV